MMKSTASKRHVAKSQQEACQMLHREVDIRPVKELAIEKLSENSPLRKVLLAERDIMNPCEFLAKMETWRYLMRT